MEAIKNENLEQYDFYIDETGNVITILMFKKEDIIGITKVSNTGEVEGLPKTESLSKDDFYDENWAVVRISEEGDMEHIEFFDNEYSAEDALHAICKKNGWKPIKEDQLGYSFNWLK